MTQNPGEGLALSKNEQIGTHAAESMGASGVAIRL